MTKNNEKKITRKEIVSNIKEQILLSKNSENDVTFEYQSLFEQIEDFVIGMKSQGLIYKDIREFIELFVETPKVTTVSHNIQYPTLTIPDLDVTEKTVVQEGKSGCMTLNTGNHFMVSVYAQLITACSIHSLEVVVVDEFRTSLADSIANDDFDRGNFSGERSRSNVHNYKSGTGVVVDADVNAAYNILRKGSKGEFKVSPELIQVSFNKKTVQLPEVNYM